MSFVKGFKFDIFVSYAHVDDAKSTGAMEGWVATLVKELRIRLAQKLGRADAFSIWKDDEQLPGNRPLTPEIVENLRQSAVILPIFSRGYLASEWCLRELETFHKSGTNLEEQRSRAFIVERDSIPLLERPPQVEDINGFRFWALDRHGIVRTLSVTPPVFEMDNYHEVLGTLVNDLAKQFRKMNEAQVEPVPVPPATPAVSAASAVEVVLEEAPARIDPVEEQLRRPEMSDGLFIGVGDFDERSFLPALRFAPDDAVALAHTFVLDLKLIAPSRARLALGGKPRTPEGGRRLEALKAAGARIIPASRSEMLLILHELREIRNQEEGLLITTFSTHGYEDGGDIYLMPQDGIRRFTSGTGLALSLLHTALHEIKAQTKLLIVDACRAPVEGGAKGAEAMSPKFEQALKQVAGFGVLCSCGAGQTSWEAPNMGLGVFTHYLRDGMLGGASAQSEDGVISLENIFAYAMSNTSEFVRKNISLEQLPWCGNKELLRNIPFAISRKARATAQAFAQKKQDMETRKEMGLRNLFEARRAHRGLIKAQVEHVERELDFLAGDALEELLENLEKLADHKASSCKLFDAWWNGEHASPVLHPAIRPSSNRSWMNSLGMSFVPVDGTLFAVHPTRVQDFKEFARDTGYRAKEGLFFSLVAGKWAESSNSWNDPGFKQGPLHPVVGVNYADAKAYCEWLTGCERHAGILDANTLYTLPSDATWSKAVGSARFPWGDDWPPPAHVGNYQVTRAAVGGSLGDLGTTPVGSYAPNLLGIYDLGGNVWEWCDDWYQKEMNSQPLRDEFDFLNDDGGGNAYRFLRGASWFNSLPRDLLSGYRNPGKYPDSRFANVGFRVVLQTGAAPAHDFHM